MKVNPLAKASAIVLAGGKRFVSSSHAMRPFSTWLD